MSQAESSRRTALIVAAGPLREGSLREALAAGGDLLIAADGGAAACLSAGATPDLVVGDLDSLGRAARARLEIAGVPVEIHPRDKDQTDLELAFDAARRRGAGRIVLLGALGGRLDHALANLLLPAAEAHSDLEVVARDGGQTVRWLHGPGTLVLDGVPGETISLLPLGGPARGVVTTGLEWALAGETLPFGPARGVSNRLIGPRAEVRLSEGVLACISPGAGPEAD